MDFSPILPPKRHKSKKRNRCKCAGKTSSPTSKRSRSAKDQAAPVITERLKRKYQDLTDRQNGAITKEPIILRPTFLKNESAGMFSKGRKSSTVTKVENYCESYAARGEGNLLDLLRGPKKEVDLENMANKENITPPNLKGKAQQPLIKDFFDAAASSPMPTTELSVISVASSKVLSASSRASVASQEVQRILNNSTVPDYVRELTKVQSPPKEPEDFVLNRILGRTESAIETPLESPDSDPQSDNLGAFMNRILYS